MQMRKKVGKSRNNDLWLRRVEKEAR
jgi:hypothetical protein